MGIRPRDNCLYLLGAALDAQATKKVNMTLHRVLTDTLTEGLITEEWEDWDQDDNRHEGVRATPERAVQETELAIIGWLRDEADAYANGDHYGTVEVRHVGLRDLALRMETDLAARLAAERAEREARDQHIREMASRVRPEPRTFGRIGRFR